MSTSFRRLVQFLGPSWLVKDSVPMPDGTTQESDSRVLYSIMAVFDAFTSRLRIGIMSRMPAPNTPADAAQYIGAGLDIQQGPSEPLVNFKLRLTEGIDDKRVSGNAWALLKQIRGYCYPYAIRCAIVNTHGDWYVLNRDGSQSNYWNTAWNWDNAIPLARLQNLAAPGTVPIPWSNFWVIIWPTTGAPQQPWQKANNWGSGDKWGQPTNRTWGSTATSDDVYAIRRIVRRWKPVGSRCSNIIVAFTDTDFDPTNASTFPTDGTWGNFAKFNAATPGRMVAARNPNAIYMAGTS